MISTIIVRFWQCEKASYHHQDVLSEYLVVMATVKKEDDIKN